RPPGAGLWPWTARWCRAANGPARSSARARRWRSCRRCRVADVFRIADRDFGSRLIIGTGGFRDLKSMGEAVIASGAEMATLALRRVDPGARCSLVGARDDGGVLPVAHTAGCFTAR